MTKISLELQAFWYAIITLFHNPYFKRRLEKNTTPKELASITAYYVVLTTIQIFFNSKIFTSSFPNEFVWGYILQTTFLQQITLLFIVTLLIPFYISFSIITKKSTNSLSFVRLTPLSIHQIIIGLLASELFLLLRNMILTFPLAIVCLFMGKVTLGYIIVTMIDLVFTAIFLAMIGLMVGLFFHKSITAAVITLVLVIGGNIFLIEYVYQKGFAEKEILRFELLFETNSTKPQEFFEDKNVQNFLANYPFRIMSAEGLRFIPMNVQIICGVSKQFKGERYRCNDYNELFTRETWNRLTKLFNDTNITRTETEYVWTVSENITGILEETIEEIPSVSSPENLPIVQYELKEKYDTLDRVEKLLGNIPPLPKVSDYTDYETLPLISKENSNTVVKSSWRNSVVRWHDESLKVELIIEDWNDLVISLKQLEKLRNVRGLEELSKITSFDIYLQHEQIISGIGKKIKNVKNALQHLSQQLSNNEPHTFSSFGTLFKPIESLLTDGENIIAVQIHGSHDLQHYLSQMNSLLWYELTASSYAQKARMQKDYLVKSKNWNPEVDPAKSHPLHVLFDAVIQDYANLKKKWKKEVATVKKTYVDVVNQYMSQIPLSISSNFYTPEGYTGKAILLMLFGILTKLLLLTLLYWFATQHIFSSAKYLPNHFSVIFSVILVIWGVSVIHLLKANETLYLSSLIYVSLLTLLILYNTKPIAEIARETGKLRIYFAPVFIILLAFLTWGLAFYNQSDDIVSISLAIFFFSVSFEWVRQLLNFKLTKTVSGIVALLFSIMLILVGSFLVPNEGGVYQIMVMATVGVIFVLHLGSLIAIAFQKNLSSLNLRGLANLGGF